MMSLFEKFVELHTSESPLILGNVWNVQSAKVFEKLKFKAIGTSSAAIANSLGYEDGENISFEEYFYLVKRISENTSLPLSVDIESGYSDDVDVILSNIIKLVEIGVVGINIEDSVLKKSTRSILSAEMFTNKLKKICNKLEQKEIKIFVNVRTDVYLLNLKNKLNEAKKRIRLYETANINGIFIPGMINQEEIKEVVNSTELPINVMCMPNLPSFNILSDIGIKRISMGNFINSFVYTQMEKKVNEIIRNQNFNSLF